MSIGVLQKNVIRFEPKLPEWKVKSINEQVMGNFTKVFAAFDAPFWPKVQYMGIALEKKGRWAAWHNFGTSGDKHILMCMVVGPEGLRVENLNEKALMDEIEELFSDIFPKKKG